MHLTQHITQKRNKQHNVHYIDIVSIDMAQNVIFYAPLTSGGSSVGQNKLLQLILGYIYILKHLQSNFIGKILFFGSS